MIMNSVYDIIIFVFPAVLLAGKDAPHLVGTTQEIEALRPKSPPPRGGGREGAGGG